MIIIQLERNRGRQFSGFVISGHAEYSEAGSDIVCAAVSALSQTALLGLLHYIPQNVIYHMEEENGFLTVRVEKCCEVSQVIFHTMVLGLEQIAQQYPSYVVLHS